MKIFKSNGLIALSAIITLLFSSCNEDDYLVDNIVGAPVQNGIFLRTLSVDNNFVDLFDIAGSDIGVTVEAFGLDNGAELANINYYIQYVDNNPDNGTVNLDEVQMGTFAADALSENPESGLKMAMVSVNAADFIAALGLDETTIQAGDQFFLRLEAVLNDGRIFSNNDIGNDIGGNAGFYRSPFIYANSVACALEDTFAVGSYILTTTTNGIFSLPSFQNGPVELVLGSGNTIRQFNVVTFPGFGGFGPIDFVIDLVCDQVVVPSGQSMGAGCAGAATTGPPDGPNGTFDINDDSTITVNFTDDEAGGCAAGGAPAQGSFTLTRI